MTFYNVAPTELFILKINNHYHNNTPKGAFFKLRRSVIMVELYINYVLKSSFRSEIIINIKVKTTSSYKDEDQVKIIGQKGKTFYVYDFYNYNNKPIDLTNSKKFYFSSVTGFWQDHYEFKKNITSMHFLSDTCIIRSNGSIPDNNIMFGGRLSSKKAGATLPTDYLPGN